MSGALVLSLLLGLLLYTQAATPTNCSASWVKSKTCSVTCGAGQAISTFIVRRPATNGGFCAAANGTTKSVVCTKAKCPVAVVDCVGEWITGNCSKTCGGGRVVSRFNITTKPKGKGAKACPKKLTKVETCNSFSCVAAVDCVGSFVNKSCSKTCGTGGFAVQTYIITVKNKGNGTKCPYKNNTKISQKCVLPSCNGVVNCSGSFVPTGNCNKPCGGGQLVSIFNITVKASKKPAGQPCDHKQGEKQLGDPCNTQACPVESESGDGSNSGDGGHSGDGSHSGEGGHSGDGSHSEGGHSGDGSHSGEGSHNGDGSHSGDGGHSAESGDGSEGPQPTGCAQYEDCMPCLKQGVAKGCGWCSATKTCMSGTATGPAEGLTCSQWGGIEIGVCRD